MPPIARAHIAISLAVLVSACSQEGPTVTPSCGSPNAIEVQAVAAGSDHTCALLTTGSVRCWGFSASGQLGDGHLADLRVTDSVSTSHRTTPTADLLSGVKAIVAGTAHTCALMATGGVRCWGDNSRGQLGDGTTTDRAIPPASDVLTDVQAIAAGHMHTCALMTSGGVRCWGDNDYGQLGSGEPIFVGDPTSSYRATPLSTDVLTDVQAIATGREVTCALMTSGGVRCWGDNTFGQLGDGTTTDRATPPTTDVLTDVRAIAAGSEHTCALMTSGGVRCWGYNDNGQLGDGTTTGRAIPATADVLTDVKAIATGNFHTCALTTSGGVRCWGSNDYGQLGDATSGVYSMHDRTAPKKADALSSVQSITAGFAHTCAVTTARGLRCWGCNSSGELGDGTDESRIAPMPVSGICE